MCRGQQLFLLSVSPSVPLCLAVSSTSVFPCPWLSHCQPWPVKKPMGVDFAHSPVQKTFPPYHPGCRRVLCELSQCGGWRYLRKVPISEGCWGSGIVSFGEWALTKKLPFQHTEEFLTLSSWYISSHPLMWVMWENIPSLFGVKEIAVVGHLVSHLLCFPHQNTLRSLEIESAVRWDLRRFWVHQSPTPYVRNPFSTSGTRGLELTSVLWQAVPLILLLRVPRINRSENCHEAPKRKRGRPGVRGTCHSLGDFDLWKLRISGVNAGGSRPQSVSSQHSLLEVYSSFS